MRQFVKACISKTDNNFIKKKTDNNVFLNPKTNDNNASELEAISS